MKTKQATYELKKAMPGSEVFRKLRPGDVEIFTGYPYIVLETFGAEFDLPLFDTFVVAMTLHLGISYEAVSAILTTGYGHQISPSTVARIMSSAREATNHSWSHKPEKRFELEDPLWPQCHALLDGVPVYCRGSSEYYNDKFGRKSIVFQVTADLAGRPLSWSKGQPGRRSDSMAIDGWVPFPHFDCEYLVADSIYIASAHCVTPFKTGVLGNPPTDVCDNFEIRHRKLRARIEHLFARLARHRWTRSSNFSPSEIPGYFNIQMHLESRHLKLLPLQYPVERVKKPLIFTCARTSCECNFTALNEIPIPRRETTRHRECLANFQMANGSHLDIVNKRSRNSAKTLPKSYTPLARKERRARNKAVCEQHTQAGKIAKRARIAERREFNAAKRSSK